MTMKYRPEIDGLRALAVIPVILFHAGFDWMPGGYAGVDVFFVISGYLITSIILDEKERGVFTLTGFYERRVRRILPALYLVLFCSIPFGWYWLLPLQFKDFTQSVSATTLFSSNFLFWLESGYFADESALKPLLHTWSLAVEEQFYLVFPALVLLTWRLGRRFILTVLVLSAVASLALAESVFLDDESANFFLTPTRIWELSLGAICAFYLRERPAPKGRATQWLSATGLLLISYTVLRFDDQTPFPGIYALVPAIGTLFVILFAFPGTLANRLLSLGPIVLVGLISYSAYLWHHPVFVFANTLSREELSAGSHVPLIIFSLLLAYLSWRYVEKPFRQRGRISRKALLSLVLPCSVLLIGVGVFGHATNGGAFRFEALEKVVLGYQEYPRDLYYRTRRCFLDKDQGWDAFEVECTGSAELENKAIVWGDSHAAALHMGLFTLFEGWDRAQYTTSGCPPVRGFSVGKRTHCQSINDHVVETIRDYSNPVVVLQANWKDYVDDPGFLDLLGDTIQTLQDSGARVTVLGGVPQWNDSLPAQYLKRFNKKSSPDDTTIRVESRRIDNLQAADRMVRQTAESRGGRFVSILDEVCEESYCDAALLDEEGMPILFTWDRAHVTYEGSLHVAGKIRSHLVQ